MTEQPIHQLRPCGYVIFPAGKGSTRPVHCNVPFGQHTPMLPHEYVPAEPWVAPEQPIAGLPDEMQQITPESIYRHLVALYGPAHEIVAAMKAAMPRPVNTLLQIHTRQPEKYILVDTERHIAWRGSRDNGWTVTSTDGDWFAHSLFGPS